MFAQQRNVSAFYFVICAEMMVPKNRVKSIFQGLLLVSHTHYEQDTSNMKYIQKHSLF